MSQVINKTTSLVFILFVASLAYAHFVASEAVTTAVGWLAYMLVVFIPLGAGLGMAFLAWFTYERVSQTRANRQLAEAERWAQIRKLNAEADKAERDAEIVMVTAPADHQVIISDLNKGTSWRPAHLDARLYANGKPAEPSQLELDVWQNWHNKRHNGGLPASTSRSQSVEEDEATWPQRIELLDLLSGEGPSLREIILGVSFDEEGNRDIVTAPLGRLVHVGVGGSSGWGKSVFLQSLAFQLATAPAYEPVELALVDSELTTFSPFMECNRLRYPVTDDEQDALAIIQDLAGEMQYRKSLFARYSPMPQNLADFNRLTDAPLPFITLMVDESTALLENKAIETALRQIVLKARKYGIFAILGGQDWKSSSLSSTIRNQFSTRVQFKALDQTQSRVLLRRPDAADITAPGRAFAIIPGRNILEMQAPTISPEAIIAALMRSKLMGNPPLDVPSPLPPEPDETEIEILDMLSQGESLSKVAREILGGDGGNQIKKVRAIRNKFLPSVVP